MPGHLNHRYLIALGSNIRHAVHGSPRAVLAAALDVLHDEGVRVICAGPVLTSRPIGPSRRAYANSAAIVECGRDPEALLAVLQQTEAHFGRRRGQRWSARVLDCDIVLWDRGPWHSPHLTIPHPHFRHRAFVLTPSVAIAPLWRDPLTGRTLRQLHARLCRTNRTRRTSRP